MTELEPLGMIIFGSFQDELPPECEVESFSASTSKATSTADKADNADLV